MKKDAMYIIIILVFAIAFMFAMRGCMKVEEDGKSNYEILKDSTEKCIAVYQANEIILNYKFDSIIKENDNFAKIDRSKEANLKIVYVQGKKEYDRAVTLPLDSAILYMQAGLNRERQYQESNH